MLLFIILDEGSDKKINNLLNRYGIKVKTVSNASGTASPSVLDYFGLAETKKDFYFAVIPDYLETKILDRLNNTFRLGDEGAGIAFTVPISSANKFLSDTFNKADVGESSENMKEDNNKYHLVITIVMEGYLEQVMAAAKRAGCSGGTVIKGRGLINMVPTKILGFNIEPEREIVLNIVTEENKNKIMEEISKEVGIKTPGKGLCVALPISSAVGLNKHE
jgi:nitrogen regulatory protein PII